MKKRRMGKRGGEGGHFKGRGASSDSNRNEEKGPGENIPDTGTDIIFRTNLPCRASSS